MPKLLALKVKGFFTAQLPGHILILLCLWLITNLQTWMIFFALYVTVIAVGFLYEVFKQWRSKRERVYAKEVRRLTVLLRNIIELAYLYDEDIGKFHRKFLETISVESLRSRGIIDPDALLQTPGTIGAARV